MHRFCRMKANIIHRHWTRQICQTPVRIPLLPKFIKSRSDDDRGILITHLNINGIQNKLEEVKQLVKEFKAQVFFLTETKIDGTPYCSVQNQWLWHLPQWPYQGWWWYYGICILENTIQEISSSPKFSTIGPLIVEVNFEKHDVVVVGIYKPSKSIDEQYYLRLEEELNNICTFASLQKQFIIVLGDLNLDRLRPERREGRILLDLEDIHGYSCLINKPTRITDHSQTLLDIVLTNKLYLFQGCDVFNPELSDHAPVYGLLKIQVKSSPFEILKVSMKKNWNTICIWHHGMLEIFLIRSRTSIASGTVYWIMSWTYMRRLRS